MDWTEEELKELELTPDEQKAFDEYISSIAKKKGKKKKKNKNSKKARKRNRK